jgi:hypothetical protein
VYNNSVQDSQLNHHIVGRKQKAIGEVGGGMNLGNYVALCDYHDYHVQGEVTSVHICTQKNKSKN